MDQQPEQKKPNFLTAFARGYSGPLAGVVLSALSAWMIVTGLKGLAGFEVTQQGALADFAVLSKDLFAVTPAEIDKVKVVRTVVGGREVYLAR